MDFRYKMPVRKAQKKVVAVYLILMCGDIESLPGPNLTFSEIQYLCKQRGISMYNQDIHNLSTNYESLCKILSSHRK